MKKSDFERHLRRHGCDIGRQGGKHEVWENRGTGATSAVPRHRELKRNTVKRICKDLEIPSPF